MQRVWRSCSEAHSCRSGHKGARSLLTLMLGALMITYIILGGPYYKYIITIMGPKALVYLLRRLHYILSPKPGTEFLNPNHLSGSVVSVSSIP